VRDIVRQTRAHDWAWSHTVPCSYDGDKADERLISPFSRPPAPPKVFTRPATPVPTASPIATPRPIAAPKPAGPVEVGENLAMGFMAGLVAAAVGAGLWALITVVTDFQIGWMAVGVGFVVGWAVRIGGKGTHSAFGVVGALLALGGCAMGNLLAIVVIAARHFEIPLLQVFSRLTPDRRRHGRELIQIP